MTTSPDFLPPPHHVFVDFENVHQIDTSILEYKAVCLTILLGSKQTKLDASLVENLMTHAASVKLIRLASTGKNALDFTLAYYIGRAVSSNPGGYFHIISKDSGFDPLVEHLRSRNIHAHRHQSFAFLNLSHPPKAAAEKAIADTEAPDEPLSKVLDQLKKNNTNRPKKKKTLLSHLKSHLGKDASDTDAERVLKKLQNAGRVRIDGKDVVTYNL